jgi:hypothetical protein
MFHILYFTVKLYLFLLSAYLTVKMGLMLQSEYELMDITI